MVPGQSLQQTRRPTTGYAEDIAKILMEKNSLSGLYNHSQDHLIKPYNYQEKSSQVAFICQQNVSSHILQLFCQRRVFYHVLYCWWLGKTIYPDILLHI